MPETVTVALLDRILEVVPTAVLVVDEAGRIAAANEEAARLFGYARAELRDEPVEILLPYRFRAAHPGQRQGFFAEPRMRAMGAGRDLFGLRRDGTEFPIEIGLRPIPTDAGLLVVSAIVDLTERKRRERRLRAAIEAAPTAMVMIDPAGTIVLVNSETERLFGYGRDELVGRKVEVLMPPRFRGPHAGLRAQYMGSPEARRMGAGRDLFGVRQDGSEFPIEIGLNPVVTDEGRFVLSAIVDISERTRQANETLHLANEALRRANAELERGNLELGRFAHIASHDLQTPMRSVASFAELLRDTYAERIDEQGREWIGRIVEAVHRQRALIDDLLAYAGVDIAREPFGDVPFADVVDDAMAMLAPALRAAGARVERGELPTVRGDRALLVQLMQHLLDNAVKHRAAAPPRIGIEAARQADGWAFAVRDNGVGVEPRYQQRIFEVFERLDESPRLPGTGIGLAVCRRVVARHGGRLWIESTPGEGSTFHFTIADRADRDDRSQEATGRPPRGDER